MNADHDFKIGSEHETCEDFALSGVRGDFAYAIVCDGCSSSDDVDFGARALALAAREIMTIARSTPLEADIFGDLIIERAASVASIFPSLKPEFLDATLLIAWVKNDRLTAYLFGDGMFFHKTSPTDIRALHIDYQIPMNGEIKAAPAYLSYRLNSKRKESYEELGGIKRVYDTLIHANEGENRTFSGTMTQHRPLEATIIQTTVAPGDVIVLSSDGINSFRHADDEPVPWQELVDDFVGFKNYEGVFVRRRLAAFQRKTTKQMISHYDDISVAAIVV